MQRDRDRVKEWMKGEQKDSKEAHRVKKGRMTAVGTVGRRMFVTPLHQLQGGWAVLRPWHAVPCRSQLIHEHTSFGLRLTSCLTILQVICTKQHRFANKDSLTHTHTPRHEFHPFLGDICCCKFFYLSSAHQSLIRPCRDFSGMRLCVSAWLGLNNHCISKFQSLVRANYPPLGTAVFH